MRFHGIFHDWMGVYREDRNGKPLYCFHNVEKVYDFLLEQGIKPFVELGFMPRALASDDNRVFSYEAYTSPPKDYEKWANLITTFTSHLVERYGREEVATWHFEVWNEPNLDGFWSGSQGEYFKLYSVSVRAVKAVDARIRVGGPATAKNEWVPEFLAHCHEDAAPVDFVSSHHYCCESALGWEVDSPEKFVRVYRGQPYMQETVRRVKEQISASAFPELPLHYTEWNVSPMHEDRFGKDSELTATFALSTLRDMDGLLDSYSWWTIFDVFEESGPGLRPFTGKYGLCNLHGILKPVGHAFRFLSKLYPEEIVTEDGQLIVTREPGGSRLRLLVWNHVEPTEVDFYGADRAIPDESRRVEISLEGVTGSLRLRRWLVDRNHGNGFRAWQRAGEPAHLKPDQVEFLKAEAEAPCVEDCILEPDANQRVEMSFSLGPCALSFIELEMM